MLRLTLTAPAAAIDATDTDARTLAGVAVPYGEAGATSAGLLTIDPGAVRIPANLRRIKLFREHGRTTPIGYATTATDTPEALHMTFAVGRTQDGDDALLEASEGLRDGLSVELANVMVREGHVTSADLSAVAQVAVPAFPGAVLTGSEDPNPEPEAEPSGDDEDDQDDDQDPDAADDGDETTEDEGDAMPDQTTVEGSQPVGMVPARTSPRQRTPANDLTLFAAAAANALRGAADASEVQAALNDLIPANTQDPGGSFMRPDWLGELWTPLATDRPFINAVGSTPLTSMVWEGWKWAVRPTVATYAGNKTAIPSSPASTAPATGTAGRIAGGWDVDRIYEDFNTGYIAALLEAATVDYQMKSEAAVAAYLAANATVITGPAADVPAGLVMIAQALQAVGAALSFVGMATDVFAAFLGIPEADVPWWLQKQGSVSIGGASTQVADLSVFAAPSLAAGTMLGGDRRAVDFRETGPFRVQAVNIPNGGIDVALFGYQGSILHDAQGLAKTTVTVPAPAGLELTVPAEVSYIDVLAQVAAEQKKTAAKKTAS